MALQFALNRLFVVTANMGTLFENVSIITNLTSTFSVRVSKLICGIKLSSGVYSSTYTCVCVSSCGEPSSVSVAYS